MPVTDQKTDALAITKERIKAWDACDSGYRWFVRTFPQGGQFAAVYAALQSESKHNDAGWLIDKVFAELDCAGRVQQTVKIAGAVKEEIEAAAAAGAQAATTGDRANAATTGYGAVAAALGYGSKARASKGGAIAIVKRGDDGALLHIFASLVGQNGGEADVWYELDATGKPVAAEAA